MRRGLVRLNIFSLISEGRLPPLLQRAAVEAANACIHRRFNGECIKSFRLFGSVGTRIPEGEAIIEFGECQNRTFRIQNEVPEVQTSLKSGIPPQPAGLMKKDVSVLQEEAPKTMPKAKRIMGVSAKPWAR